MTSTSVRRLLASGVAAAAAGLVLGCSPSPAPPPGEMPSQSSVITPPVAPSSPTAHRSSATAATSAASERQAPPRPTAPPATTAGSLGAGDLPAELPGGFRAAERPPAEEERLPNGSWVYQTPADQAVWEAMPRCEANDGRDWPTARYALGGTYLDAQGRPGNALVIEFSDAAAARAYATAYRAVLASCPRTDGMPAAEHVAEGDHWYAGRRSYGTDDWSEVVADRGTRVWLAIWNDRAGTEDAALTALARRLAGV